MTTYKLPALGMIILLALLLVGCGAASNEAAEAEPATAPPQAAAEAQQPPTLAPTATDSTAPVAPLESSETGSTGLESSLPRLQNQLPDHELTWSQLLAKDAIRPIYNPEFVPAAEAPYEDNELVIGVEINGEAKAYAIGPLNSREMVNDTIGGTPVLVTW